MSALRKSARGKTCQVRLHSICNHNPETTVLAHLRLPGTCGTGTKPHDLIGVRACSSCHDAIGDGRMEYAPEIIQAWGRTITVYAQEGLI